MTGSHLEVEDTYDVADVAELPRLDDWPGVASVDSERFQLEATYFDTADLAAIRARITVRRRTGGGDAGWHVKLPAGAHADDGRQEVHLPLGRALHTVPKPLRDLLRAHLRDAPLTPVAVLRTDRTVHRLRDADGTVLAEIADDRVTGDSVRVGRVRSWREWEVELVGGDRGLLRTATKRLGAAGGRRSATGSKLARTLGDLVPATAQPPRLRKGGPSGDVVRARLAEQHAELLRRDPAVRQDVRGAVHRMRVACRRLRTALATYRPFLDADVTEPLRDELRWLGGVLGEVRDAEVQRRYLARWLDTLPDDTPGFADAWAVVGTDTETWAADSRQALLAALDTPRYLALLDGLAALVDDPPYTEAARRPVRTAMTKRVRQEWKRLVRRLQAVDAADPDDRGVALHEARKAAKRARYAVEPLRPAYGKHAKRLVRQLEDVQELLGDHHDTLAAREWLRAAAASPTASGAGFALGVLHERLGERGRRLERRLDRRWPEVARPRLRAWLS